MGSGGGTGGCGDKDLRAALLLLLLLVMPNLDHDRFCTAGLLVGGEGFVGDSSSELDNEEEDVRDDEAEDEDEEEDDDDEESIGELGVSSPLVVSSIKSGFSFSSSLGLSDV